MLRWSVDNFEGTTEDYIKKLEAEVLALREQLSDEPPSVSPVVEQLGEQPSSSPNIHQRISLQPSRPIIGQLGSSPDTTYGALTPPPEQGSQDVKFLFWTKDAYEDKKRKPPVRPTIPPRLRTFLDRVPQDEATWRKRLSDLELSTSTGALRLFHDLISATVTQAGNAETAFDGTLDSYAERIRVLTTASFRYKVVSRFCSLILVTACSVALQKGHPQKEVDAALRKSLRITGEECTANDVVLARYRHGAEWIVKQTDELYGKLGDYAFEFVLIGCPALTTFDDLVRDDQAPVTFRDEILKLYKPEKQERPIPFSVPLFVWFLFPHFGSFDEICEVLGSTRFSEDDAQKYLQTYSAWKSEACCSPATEPTKRRKRRHTQAWSGRMKRTRGASKVHSAIPTAITADAFHSASRPSDSGQTEPSAPVPQQTDPGEDRDCCEVSLPEADVPGDNTDLPDVLADIVEVNNGQTPDLTAHGQSSPIGLNPAPRSDTEVLEDSGPEPDLAGGISLANAQTESTQNCVEGEAATALLNLQGRFKVSSIREVSSSYDQQSQPLACKGMASMDRGLQYGTNGIGAANGPDPVCSQPTSSFNHPHAQAVCEADAPSTRTDYSCLTPNHVLTSAAAELDYVPMDDRNVEVNGQTQSVCEAFGPAGNPEAMLAGPATHRGVVNSKEGLITLPPAQVPVQGTDRTRPLGEAAWYNKYPSVASGTMNRLVQDICLNGTIDPKLVFQNPP